jgi:hypothetical protein
MLTSLAAIVSFQEYQFIITVTMVTFTYEELPCRSPQTAELIV